MYKRIEDYGVIGDMHSVALVGIDGSIDWCCLPNFDSPSVFAAILDENKGGYFRVWVNSPTTNKQLYFPDSNILLTRFLNQEGVGEVMDFMPIERNTPDDPNRHQIFRIARAVRGRVSFRIECVPAFDYARGAHRTSLRSWGAFFSSRGQALKLHSPVRFRRFGAGGVAADFTLKAGESASFALSHHDRGSALEETLLTSEEGFQRTSAHWHRWLSQMTYRGRWREMVARSALTLKMLTFAPTGALVAAPTCSLPEEIGGVRNWDYRYTWIRDASFTIYALLRLGFSEEAGAFMKWLQDLLASVDPDKSLQIVYTIQGGRKLPEVSLPHLEGYRKSAPVRIGNAAYEQPQLDIYGELMDSVYLYDKYGSPISYDLWRNLRRMLDHVCRNWQGLDRGIWEIRGASHAFVYSRVMCWVALDRGLRLARKRSFPGDWTNWVRQRDAIFEEVMSKGWDPRRRSFRQRYGAGAMDASTLIFPLVKFISPTDPRMVSTLARIRETLVSDSLVYRYQADRGLKESLPGLEGTFSMCTFWYVEALARAGDVADARWVFEKMLGYANHLGLYSEEIGPSGEQLGNFPQAFTHLGLISAAFNLDRLLNAGKSRRD